MFAEKAHALNPIHYYGDPGVNSGNFMPLDVFLFIIALVIFAAIMTHFKL